MHQGKRPFDAIDNEDIDQPRRKSPALTRVILADLKIDDIRDLEPSHHRVERNLQLRFESLLPTKIFAGSQLRGEHGGNIAVALVDPITGNVVDSGLGSRLKLDVVVVSGDFNEDEKWGEQEFATRLIMKPREGRPPLLQGATTVKLENGVGYVGKVTFTDNSRWTRTGTFKLGAMVSPGQSNGGDCIGKAFSNAFAVRDQRGELDRKHYPPKPNDDVWRLEHIRKKGVFHKRLVYAGINTVRDFVQLERIDPQRLRLILGARMSEKIWSSLAAHARTYELSEERCLEKDRSLIFNKNLEQNQSLQCPNSGLTMLSNHHVQTTATCGNGVVLGQDWQDQNIEGLAESEYLDYNILDTGQDWQNQDIEALDYNICDTDQDWQNQNMEALDYNICDTDEDWQNQNMEAQTTNDGCEALERHDGQNQNIQVRTANDGITALEGHCRQNQIIEVPTENYGNKPLGYRLRVIGLNDTFMEYVEMGSPYHVNSSPMKWLKIVAVMKVSMVIRKRAAEQRAQQPINVNV